MVGMLPPRWRGNCGTNSAGYSMLWRLAARGARGRPQGKPDCNCNGFEQNQPHPTTVPRVGRSRRNSGPAAFTRARIRRASCALQQRSASSRNVNSRAPRASCARSAAWLLSKTPWQCAWHCRSRGRCQARNLASRGKSRNRGRGEDGGARSGR